MKSQQEIEIERAWNRVSVALDECITLREAKEYVVSSYTTDGGKAQHPLDFTSEDYELFGYDVAYGPLTALKFAHHKYKRVFDSYGFVIDEGTPKVPQQDTCPMTVLRQLQYLGVKFAANVLEDYEKMWNARNAAKAVSDVE